MKKALVWVGILLLIALGLFAFWYVQYRYPFKSVTAGDLTIDNTTIVVEVANTSLLRTTGLSGRDKLEDKAGMLFAFSKAGKYEFWMKDMKFALDIIWFDKGWKVVDIKQNFTPDTYPSTVTSKVPALYAIEVNAGFVERYGVKEGDVASFEPH